MKLELCLSEWNLFENGPYEEEARRDAVRAETRMRQQATPHAEITEQARECARKTCEASMRQYVMVPIGEMPRGIVYADSPLRKKDEDAD